MADDPQINSWEDFRAYVIHADIKFVRPDYVLRLRRGGRVFPRRQEAEEEEGPLFQPTSTTQAGDFTYVAVSHCWESREHPDPHGFQLAMLAAWISRRKAPASEFCRRLDYLNLDRDPQIGDELENVVLSIDYYLFTSLAAEPRPKRRVFAAVWRT